MSALLTTLLCSSLYLSSKLVRLLLGVLLSREVILNVLERGLLFGVTLSLVLVVLT